MNRRLRILIGVIILTVSIALLIWGYKPPGREIRTKPIAPSELQLPTPSSLLPPFKLVS